MKIEEITPIVFGGGAFNTQYDKDPTLGDPADILRYAYDHGVRTFDTAAFYGPSEDLVGKALRALQKDVPRDTFFVCTKAGRWEDDTFDYSPESITRSVNRSLQRLGLEYVDLVYLHDVEFLSLDEALVALATLNSLRKEGKLRYVGFSGYPVDELVKCAQLAAKDEKIGGVDAILSYCNLTIQNNRLEAAIPELKAAGVKVLLNASPLSMSLLRSGPTHSFHPASDGLKASADAISKELKDEGIEIADEALAYSISSWNGPTVIGLRTPQEIDSALEALKAKPTEGVVERIRAALGKHFNETWDSGRIAGLPGKAV